MYDLLVDLWVLVVGSTLPDYISKAFYWFSFSFLILTILLPLIVVIVLYKLIRGAGSYD